MYLTRFHINKARREAKSLLASPQRMHAAVMSSYPNDPGRVLWRVDAWPGKTLLYIQSATPPDLTHLVEQAGWPTLEIDWETKEIGPFYGNVTNGDVFHFRLRANPTQVFERPKENGGRGKRVPCRTVNQCYQWLIHKSEDFGFSSGTVEAPTFQVVANDNVTFIRNKGRVPLTSAVFQGQLTVTNEALFRDHLEGGFGRAKGYGCGLMTLVPRN